MANILSNLARGGSNFLRRFGTELGAPGTLARQAEAEKARQAEQVRLDKELEQRQQLGRILSGQSTPAFLRPGGAEGLTPEQSQQLQLDELAGLGTPEALGILAKQSPLTEQAITPLQERKLELEKRAIAQKERASEIELRDVQRKEQNAIIRQDLLKSFGAVPAQKQQINEATKPITSTGKIENILDQASARVDKAAQFAAATGDKSLLDAAKAQYDIAQDKYERRTGKDIKDAEFQAAGFFERMNAAETGVQEIGEAGFPTFNVALISGSAGKTAANLARNPQQQVFARAADDWIRAKLRKESGAVIADEEMQDEFRTYFPVIGDTPEVITAKASARELATRNMGRAGSRALRIQAPETVGAAPAEPSTSFKTVQQAEAANLPVGTEIIINGRRAVVE